MKTESEINKQKKLQPLEAGLLGVLALAIYSLIVMGVAFYLQRG